MPTPTQLTGKLAAGLSGKMLRKKGKPAFPRRDTAALEHPAHLSSEGKDGVFSGELDHMLNRYWLERTAAFSGDAIPAPGLGQTGSNPHGNREMTRDKIVARVQPYIRKIAFGLARRTSDPVDDLIQVGNIGLLKALEKYNPMAGTRFKTYATYLVTGEIRHYLRDKSAMIKAPRPLYELYYRMNQIVQQLTEHLGRTPTDEEIADRLQCPVDTVNQVQDAEHRRQTISLDQFYVGENQEGETLFVERLVDERYDQLVERREDHIILQTAMSRLKPELQDVVRLTYFEDLSQCEIAQRLGVSQMQISRRHRKALLLLGESFKNGENTDNAPTMLLMKIKPRA